MVAIRSKTGHSKIRQLDYWIIVFLASSIRGHSICLISVIRIINYDVSWLHVHMNRFGISPFRGQSRIQDRCVALFHLFSCFGQRVEYMPEEWFREKLIKIFVFGNERPQVAIGRKFLVVSPLLISSFIKGLKSSEMDNVLTNIS